MTISEETLREVVNEYLDLLAQMEKDAARRSVLADIIAANLAEGDRFEIVPGVGVRVQPPPRRFDGDKIITMLTPQQLAMVSLPSPALVKAHFPVLYEAARTPGGKSSVRSL